MDRKVTLITGTRKGIGRALAEHYLDNGHIVVGCSRGESDLSREDYHHRRLDVANESKVKELVAFIRNDLGHLDHLVNNAGIASMNHSLLTPISTVQKVLDTNVKGTFLFCREATKLMKKKKFGRIVNFTSVAVPLKLEGEAIYAASKAAVVSLTQILAREFAEFGVTVNAVGPTPVETDLIASVPGEKIDRLIGMQAIARLGTFEDIANVVDFFLREESGFITGQSIYLGGV